MNLACIGAGHVGLVTAACFAEMGNEVICVDVVEGKVEAPDKGRMPFYEPGLEDMVRRNCHDRRLFFSNNLAAAVENSLICFITVDPPPQADGAADLAAVWAVAREIGRHLNGYKIIVLKSTVPVGTAVKVREIIDAELQNRAGHFEFDVVVNPEFFKEGTAIDDFMKPDRIVIGCDNVKVAELMKELYAAFVRTHHPIVLMDAVSAELTKYAANAFLAARISFINEIAHICARTGADIDLVRQGMGSDPRIGRLFLFPGLGYGGSGFPKDLRALINTAQSRGYTPRLLAATEAINRDQVQVFLDRIYRHFENNLAGRLLAVWGLAFKPGTDDVRQAPALKIVAELIRQGARVRAYDPQAVHAAQKALGEVAGLGFTGSGYDALEGAEALIITTDWTIFREPDFPRMQRLMQAPVIFDGRNLYHPAKMAKLGFQYFYVGQKG